ncbi:MAG: sensor histidine kinase [Firmicutes bacterium]|nr:sensor histidine kinase [Bacillota bacterium]
MKKSFEASAKVVLEIGRDSIESKLVALSEIIKNSYDANAKNCNVKVYADGEKNNLFDNKITSIEITDDGVGMNQTDLLNNWMVIGNSSKHNSKFEIKEGRIPIGEKGIGRFAVNKIGNLLTLITKKENDKCYQLFIDFNRFDEDTNLQNIDFEILEVKNDILEKNGHGTILKIDDLNENWDYNEISKVYDEILKLQSPFKDKNDIFNVNFELPNGYSFENKLKPEEVIEKSLWRTVITVDPKKDKSKMIFEFEPYVQMKGFSKINKEIAFEHCLYGKNFPQKIDIDKYRIGTFTIRLFAFHRSTNVLKMLGDKRKSLKEYLDENGGVRIYRGGQRIYNYGSKNEDWLDLNLKRLNSPGKKLSKNILIGIVDLDPVESSDLKEKTNREGFTENGAFIEFKKIVSAAIDRFAFEIIESKDKIKEIYDKNVKNENIDGSFEQLLDEIEEAEFNNPSDKEKLLELTNRTINEYRESKKIYLSIANNSVDFHMVFHDIDKRVNGLINQVEQENVNLSDVKKTVHAINDILRLQKDLITNRDFKLIDSHNLLKKFEIYSKYRVKDHNINLTVDSSNFKFKCIESQILRILMNLMDNSVYWLNNINNNKKILIRILQEKEKTIIYFADNGPGLGVEDPTFLFKPFVTKKDDGLGLGLYIIDEIVNMHNGVISVVENDDNIPSEYVGAKFKIELSME